MAQQRNFMESMGGGQGGSGLVSLLQTSAHQDPRLRAQREQQASGWAAPVGQAAFLGGQFLEGVRQGRVQKFLLDEQKREREWGALAQSIDRRLQDPDLTPAGRQALQQAATQVATQRFMEETKDAAKDKKSVPGQVAGIFRNIAVGLTGGEMPQGSKKIEPGAIMLDLERKLGESPDYSRKATLDWGRSAWLGAVQKATEEAGGDPNRVDQKMIMRHAAPVLSRLANVLGQEEADRFGSTQIAGYAPSQESIRRETEARTINDLLSPSQKMVPAGTGDAVGMAPPEVRSSALGTPAQIQAGMLHQLRVSRGLEAPMGKATYYDPAKPNDPGFAAYETFDPTGKRVWVDARTQAQIDPSKLSTTAPRRETTEPITLNNGKIEIPGQRNTVDGTVSFLQNGKMVTVAPAEVAKYGLSYGQVHRDPAAAQLAIMNRNEITSAARAASAWTGMQQRQRASFNSQAQAIDLRTDINPEDKKAMKLELKSKYEQDAADAYDQIVEQIKTVAPNLSEAELKKRTPPPPPGYNEFKMKQKFGGAIFVK